MIVLFGSTSGPKLRAYWGDRPNLGCMLSPESWRTPWCTYACDNDVYAHRTDPDWWCRKGEPAWLRMLDKITVSRPPMFALLPDVVADWPHTLERAQTYRIELQARGIPIAIALQNGCDYDQAQHIQPSTVFVGGSTRWKWEHAEEIQRYFQPRGIKVHIGRACGPRRIRECIRLNVDSCDGTGWSRHADKMLPKLWAALDGTYEATPQQRLAL